MHLARVRVRYACVPPYKFVRHLRDVQTLAWLQRILKAPMMGSGHTVVVCMHCGMTMNRRMYRVLPTIGHGLCVTPSRDHGSSAIEHMVASTWESNGLH